MKRHLLYIVLLFFSCVSLAQNKSCGRNLNARDFQVVIDSCSNEIIIDVRPTDIFKNKIIAGAIFVPSKEDLKKFMDTLDRDTPILVYCTIGKRSATVCNLLCEKEFKHVVNLSKGIENWKKRDFEVVNAED
jgi:rhodanese-related sulfurtransferase